MPDDRQRTQGRARRIDGRLYVTLGGVEHGLDDAEAVTLMRALAREVGLCVVPKVATVEMEVAATEEWLTVRAMEDRAAVIWRAMVEAAQGGETG